MRQKVKISYTIYSANYVPEVGECWEYPSFSGARWKAKSIGPGSIIVKNFERYNRRGEFLDYEQAERCWVWNALRFRKVYSLNEEAWKIAAKTWWPASELRQLRRRRR